MAARHGLLILRAQEHAFWERPMIGSLSSHNQLESMNSVQEAPVTGSHGFRASIKERTP
jgi:hypothetical protein